MKHADRHTDRQADRQTDRQTEDRQTDTSSPLCIHFIHFIQKMHKNTRCAVWGLRFSWQCGFKSWSSGLWHCVLMW